LTDQAGRAGYVDLWPRDSENQPHHAGVALIWGPDGDLLASTQEARIREEMIVATLDAALLARERSLANYMLRTRRPELFGELLRDQVSSGHDPEGPDCPPHGTAAPSSAPPESPSGCRCSTPCSPSASGPNRRRTRCGRSDCSSSADRWGCTRRSCFRRRR